VLGDDKENQECIWYARVVKKPERQTNLSPVNVAWLTPLEDSASNDAIILTPFKERNETIELGSILDKVTVSSHHGKKVAVSLVEQQRIAEIGNHTLYIIKLQF